MAPSGPIQLRTPPLAACVRLGSASDHVNRLSDKAVHSTSSAPPPMRRAITPTRLSSLLFDSGSATMGLGPGRTCAMPVGSVTPGP